MKQKTGGVKEIDEVDVLYIMDDMARYGSILYIIMVIS